ncbi:hypothetical protein TWF730_004031 [Orbilia blumenaviensis]|uniref:Rhodopsin domain-containing protein n=1 Tax=Orbilia blumenaviensis TaxID=1796055 RepID=A0AAV9U2E4_9PEZI
MANQVNLTRLLEFAERSDMVRKAGLLPVVIPEDILREQVLNPNYHPKDLPKQLLITTWLCIFTPLVGVVLRFMARFGTESPLGADDWFSAVTWVFGAAYGATTILAVNLGGAGRHIWLVDDAGLEAMYLIGYFHQIAYGVASFFLHITIMFFYIRIIPSELFARKILYLFFLFHILYLPVFIGVSAAQCSPVRAGWDLRYRWKLGEETKCMDSTKLVTALTVVGVVTDCLLFLLPLSVVWRLGLEVGQKVLVSGLFLIGGLACIASGIRLHYLKILYASFDRTYHAMPVNALGHTEIALGLLAACLPMMRQAVLLMLPARRGVVFARVMEWLRRRRRRGRRGSVRVQKIDSRSTRITTADAAEARGALEMQGLEGVAIPPLPALPAPAVIAGDRSDNTPNTISRWSILKERHRLGNNNNNNNNVIKNSTRHDRLMRDIAREAYRVRDINTASGEMMEIDDMWIMMEDGPVRVPIRYDVPDDG